MTSDLTTWMEQPACLTRLMAIARLQLTHAGQLPTASAVYRRVQRLRRDEIQAHIQGRVWQPLPAAVLIALDAHLVGEHPTTGA